MSDESLTAGRLELLGAIGDCLMTWANIELHLGQIFRSASGTSPVKADVIWSSVISFDGKMTMLNNLMSVDREKDDQPSDWQLLHDCTRRMSKHRNEIAHATMLNVQDKFVALEPFFVMTKEKPKLLIDDVRQRTAWFRELEFALFWLGGSMLESRVPQALQVPEPSLLQRLRLDELKRREEQSRRDRLKPQ